ncbi:melatonin receptor type 1B-B-like [Stylophora pistillata]|uniref:melatonin receptor type 1B-B-like n=1 Tax=Stylophora pistillata TaxID=50429 RepID=UPI000C057319|nr:melatonin receptor type 1B-B-like [Stylophora pistillata]
MNITFNRMNITLDKKKILEDSLKDRKIGMIIAETSSALIIAILALIGNLTLCLAIYGTRALRCIQNYYIVALAASDLLLTILCLPLGLTVVILGRWPFGDAICQIQGSFIYYFACFSVLTMTLIAVNRYIKMMHSVIIYQRFFTKSNVLISIAFCAIFSGIFLIPFVSQRFCFHPGKCACFVCKSRDGENQAVLIVPYTILITMTYPVITFCYSKVFRKVHLHFSRIAPSNIHENSAKSYAEEVKITKILFAVLIAFVMCWTPPFIIEFIDMFHGQYRLPRQVYLIMPFMGAANCAVNPLIYGLLQRRFREAYINVLTCRN